MPQNHILTGRKVFLPDLFIVKVAVPRGFLWFCKVHKKTPVPASVFYKVTGCRPAALLKDTPLQTFSCESCNRI